MSKTLVSIVIPTWNSEKYIKESVESALSQTYEYTEVIVIDDGSTDHTKEILDSHISSKRINYIYQENKGLASARNTGIRSSKGEFIAFLDSDDIFLPEKIKKQIHSLENNADFDVSYCDILHFTDTEPREYFHHRYQYPSGQIFSALLKKQFINPLSVVVKKSIFDKCGLFDENLRRSEDWELWLRLARAGIKFYHLNEILAHYRIRSAGNLSSVESEPEMKEKNLDIFTKLNRILTPLERHEYNFQKILRRLRLKVVFANLLVGNKKKATSFAEELSVFWRILVGLTPASLWKSSLKYLWKIKQRLLLKSV